MTPNDLIAGGYRVAKALLHRMVDDLTPEEFAHQPVAGSNSAAWVVGHLAVTMHRTAKRLGAADLPAVPDEMAARFAQTGRAADVQTALGDPAELVRLFDACADRAMAAVKALPPEAFDAPPVGPPLATSAGEVMLFGGLHVAMHVGQLSTVRRSLGKPPAV